MNLKTVLVSLVVAGTAFGAIAVAQVGKPAKKQRNRPAIRAAVANMPPAPKSLAGSPESTVNYALAEALSRPPAYRGLSVAPAHDVQPGERDVQERVAKILGSKDFVPNQRIEHFAWCDAPDLTVVGWCGQIQKVENVGGGVRVTMVVSPNLLVGRRPAFTLDRFHETYDLAGNSVQFVHGIAAPGSSAGIAGFD